MNRIKISKNFSLHEFECRDGSHLVKIDEKLVEKLQQLRDKIGLPIYINSGYRTLEHNRKLGSEDTSQHVLGKAADISVRGWTAKQIAAMAETVGFGGIGIYHKQNFVHVDVREKKARWEE